MTVAAGGRIGPYDVVAPLGAGGMGEVFRAKDPRLGRDVAIKVLPAELSADADRLRRFEKEARNASALNHPNIVTIYDAGGEGGMPWIAMELVDGQTLRQLIGSGPLPVRKLLPIAAQIAQGLARAHEVGIVHRDLKPENVMVTRDGLVKILDFGLAKLNAPLSGSDQETQFPTVTGTSPGVVMGTVAYMSPEQAAGHAVDFRSDQFALGSILYEMATGRHAFQGKTAVDILAAILNEEPEPIASASPQTPPPVRWIVERCLAKEPGDRYLATGDLAKELSGLQGRLPEVSSGSVAAAAANNRSLRPRLVVAAGLAAALAAGYLVSGLRTHPDSPLRFQKVTFQRGGLWRARFTPDGQSVVYSMIAVGDDAKPPELYAARVGGLDSRPMNLPPADIFSISSTGQMAIGLANPAGPGFGDGTLAQVSLSGGTPRQMMEHVRFADWSPDGKDLAVLRIVGDKLNLEFPIGKVLLKGLPRFADLHFSHDGTRVALDDNDGARVIDRQGKTIALLKDVAGTVWSPGNDEIWWLKAPPASAYAGVQSCELHATNLRGRDRVLVTLPGDYVLHDVSRDGRLLLERDDKIVEMTATFPGRPVRSLAWLDQSVPVALSSDGRLLLFADRADAAGVGAAVYLRGTDGAPAVRLGAGHPIALSPDNKWALVRRGRSLLLLPTGPGQERTLTGTGVSFEGGWAGFHPDGKRIIFRGIETGHRERAYEQSLDGGPPRALTPEGIRPTLLSPDGATLLIQNLDTDELALFALGIAGAVPRAVAASIGTPVHWNEDGRSILVVTDLVRVERLDLASGRRTPWREFSEGGRLGMGTGTEIALTPREDAWVFGYQRWFSELLVLEGLK
jgi:eukaryotic-like serine/threonine-protein kinase